MEPVEPLDGVADDPYTYSSAVISTLELCSRQHMQFRKAPWSSSMSCAQDAMDASWCIYPTDAAELRLKPCESTQHKKFQGDKLASSQRHKALVTPKVHWFQCSCQKLVSKCTQQLKDKNSLRKVYLLGRKNPRHPKTHQGFILCFCPTFGPFLWSSMSTVAMLAPAAGATSGWDAASNAVSSRALTDLEQVHER